MVAESGVVDTVLVRDQPTVPGTSPTRSIEPLAGDDRALPLHIGLLTGGDDRPYALGMASALTAQGIRVDLIGSDALDAPELHASPLIDFRNLRGDQSESASLLRKAARIVTYYAKLVRYAARSRPRVFHILWNNRFQLVDRTVLMAYYRALGRRVVLTAHNVNAAKRDGCDTLLNRASLGVQYRLCSHILVHTERMKRELVADFGIDERRVTVIPFGINDTIPSADLTAAAARERLGLEAGVRTVLCFGQIAPYKGIEYLVEALDAAHPEVHLIIAGKVKRGHEDYWEQVRWAIEASSLRDRVSMRIGFVPDDEVETYFKAADVVALPYTAIFQSGVPFLAFNFGVPVVATDVGSLREDIVDGTNGFLCLPRDAVALARTLETYFGSDLYRERDRRRGEIRQLALERHSWDAVGRILRSVYESVGSASTARGQGHRGT